MKAFDRESARDLIVRLKTAHPGLSLSELKLLTVSEALFQSEDWDDIHLIRAAAYRQFEDMCSFEFPRGLR